MHKTEFKNPKTDEMIKSKIHSPSIYIVLEPNCGSLSENMNEDISIHWRKNRQLKTTNVLSRVITYIQHGDQQKLKLFGLKISHKIHKIC